MALMITNSDFITIVLWGLGIVATILIALAVHIGNEGSKIKDNVALHGERISRVETGVENLEATGNRIEKKVDDLLMKRK